jgi:hypothetical protein
MSSWIQRRIVESQPTFQRNVSSQPSLLKNKLARNQHDSRLQVVIWLILRPWRWRVLVPSKRRLTTLRCIRKWWYIRTFQTLQKLLNSLVTYLVRLIWTVDSGQSLIMLLVSKRRISESKFRGEWSRLWLKQTGSWTQVQLMSIGSGLGN